MNDRDNTRRLQHIGDDEAFIERLKNAVPRLQSRNHYTRLLAAAIAAGHNEQEICELAKSKTMAVEILAVVKAKG